MVDANPTIEAYQLEERRFPPSEGFKEDALVVDPWMYDDADRDWQGFWARQAADLLDWAEDWHTILEWDLPFAKWFVGGKLNVSYNCVDRHVEALQEAHLAGVVGALEADLGPDGAVRADRRVACHAGDPRRLEVTHARQLARAVHGGEGYRPPAG